jgi:pimeloyl-ACP methyl ester carboxylesterase
MQNIYHPVKLTNDPQTDIKNNVEIVYFNSEDGTRINALYVKAKADMPTIIAFHGNSGNIELEQNLAKFCNDNGYGVLLTDYRGYGKSSGSPSENGLYMDAEASLKYLKNKKHLEERNLFVWGVSLGSAVAVDLASKHKFKGLVLSSTFTDIADVAAYLLNTKINKENNPNLSLNIYYFIKFLPLSIKYDNFAKIKKINCPILIINSKQDRQFPYEMAEELASQNKKAKLFLSEYGAHGDIDWMKKEILKFLAINR